MNYSKIDTEQKQQYDCECGAVLEDYSAEGFYSDGKIVYIEKTNICPNCGAENILNPLT